MTLIIGDDARRQIQKDVDALTQSPRHYNIKADRARTYFPVIEKIFIEEGVPADFKYLVLQESSLVADAVSVSNAVGFWQFKDYTAMEMGLRVDNLIDERMNIVSATRAAARYIKKNNSVFDNWIFALQAYQMGAGGVMRSVKDTHPGKKEMEISSSTYWYVKKFLAYKVAYEPAVAGRGQTELIVFETNGERRISDLCKEFALPEEELRNYNKWIREDKIPGDKSYAVFVPNSTGITIPTTSIFLASDQPRVSVKAQAPISYQPIVQRINGVRAVQALPGESAARFAERVDVDVASFVKWNDITYNTPLGAGQYYFLSKKRARAEQDRHVVKKGETLWTVSQKYGLRLSRLKRFNRVEGENVEPGTVLWLTRARPKTEKVTVVAVTEMEADTAFAWNSAQVVTADPVSGDSVTVVKATDSIVTALPTREVYLANADSTGISKVSEGNLTLSEHVVQPKETFYAIAHLYNVGVMDIVRWNNLDIQQGLKIGQVIKINAQVPKVQEVEKNPEAEKSEVIAHASEIIHEVKSSDTLYSIARKYGVTIKDLMELNQKKDFNVSVGEKLKVKAQ